MAKQRLTDSDALLIVDVQRDFCPGGALAIEGGDEVVAVLNRWIEEAIGVGAKIVFSRDWHPPDHMSFESQGGQWPSHCVGDTKGAARQRRSSWASENASGERTRSGCPRGRNGNQMLCVSHGRPNQRWPRNALPVGAAPIRSELSNAARIPTKAPKRCLEPKPIDGAR